MAIIVLKRQPRTKSSDDLELVGGTKGVLWKQPQNTNDDYSLPLVLRILEKAIRAVELTTGTDDPRVIRTDQRQPPTPRRSTRRGNT